jgi:hypothetical protein
MKSLARVLWRALRAVLLALAAVILVIEEWGWRPLSAWAARLAHWPPIARLEARIRGASPRTALVLFLVPALLLFPIKLLALWFIHRGRAAIGVLVIVAAKLIGTALVGRLFVITEPQLMRFAWFVRALTWWQTTKRRVREAVTESAAWKSVRRLRRRIGLCLRRSARGAR